VCGPFFLLYRSVGIIGHSLRVIGGSMGVIGDSIGVIRDRMGIMGCIRVKRISRCMKTASSTIGDLLRELWRLDVSKKKKRENS